ncbi:MAG: hypothetical protein GEV05_09270 [Betaproteobacteria bacterium]|nr:hypothetical protein [Betaproteobacteria bacterium]
MARKKMNMGAIEGCAHYRTHVLYRVTSAHPEAAACRFERARHGIPDLAIEQAGFQRQTDPVNLHARSTTPEFIFKPLIDG